MQDTNQIDPRVIAKYVMQYQKEGDDILHYQLDTEKELETLKHEFLGETFDEKSNEWVVDKRKMRICNERGANAIIGFLKPTISRIVSLSNFKRDDDIDNYSYYDITTWIKYLTQHKADFELESFADISIICSTIDKLNVSTMKKAVLGWEGDGLRKSFTHVESNERVMQVDNKPSLFGGLLSKKNN